MIIVLGMAGAGKSTQCRLLAQNGDYQWLSVGQYLRSVETGDNRAEMMLGKVLNDDVVTPLVREEINRLGDTPELLLDGCPRTVNQAKWLAGATDTPLVSMVLHLVIDDRTAMDRLLKRGREDDSQEAMKLRFAGYHRDIKPVLDEFAIKGVRVVQIDARGQQDTVYNNIIRELDRHD